MIDTVIKSIHNNLIGLDNEVTPIFITVDEMPMPKPTNSREEEQKQKDEYESKTHALDEYISNLYHNYLIKAANIHIVVSTEHHHIGGNVWKALGLIKDNYPSVKYLYYVQHDFEFVRPVDHMALLQTVKERNNNNNTKSRSRSNAYNYTSDANHAGISSGDKINYVLFQYKNRNNFCRPEENNIAIMSSSLSSTTTSSTIGNSDINNIAQFKANLATTTSTTTTMVPSEVSASNSTFLCSTCTYSDNNHFVEFDWYYQMIDSLGYRKRPPEDPMMNEAAGNCRELGLYLYVDEVGVTLSHLDGRGSN